MALRLSSWPDMVTVRRCACFDIVYNKRYERLMAEKLEVKELDQVVVRFSGDSGDGMQLAGNIFSTV